MAISRLVDRAANHSFFDFFIDFWPLSAVINSTRERRWSILKSDKREVAAT
jgi:hypothetical protein